MNVSIDLSKASIVTARDLSAVELKAVEMLQVEVRNRTGLTWPVLRDAAGGPAVVVHHADGSGPAEGYRLKVIDGVVDIRGNDELGTLFGVGRLLRELAWGQWKAQIAPDLDIATVPHYRLRGHQVGYRPKVNTYDGWTPEIFEQYVRDLAIFGCNAVELIPPKSDDDDYSPHFPIPKLEAMIEWSRIAASYGLKVWAWYPALDGNYENPAVVEKALKEWEHVLSSVPRIDALNIPGGDPGHTEPVHLFPFLAQVAKILRRYHPGAEIWVAPQGFNARWIDQFVELIDGDVPWLSGVVYAPWTRMSMTSLRELVPARYPMRYYPDITHQTHSEFTVPNWDIALAVTQGREGVNPQPIITRQIFEANMPSTIGFISYSEGVHDDINKCIWSSLAWDPSADMTDILRQYARCYISARDSEAVAQLIFRLEENWRGPLITNGGVEATLRQARQLESAATPQMLLSWRFQQILYRAYFDAYVRARLIRETALEQEALEHLREAERTGSLIAMNAAESALNRAVTEPFAPSLRSRIFALGEALYQSIRMQLSVDRYAAIAVSRGANLDTVDVPLTGRVYLTREFARIRAIEGEIARLTALDLLTGRTDPGPGGFYDDLGNPANQPHLVVDGLPFHDDPGCYTSARVGYATLSGCIIGRSSSAAFDADGDSPFLGAPRNWWTWIETRYETPLTMRYDRLDPNARYKVRLVAAKERTGRPIRLVANGEIEVHDWRRVTKWFEPMEFDIPTEATKSGALTLRWHPEPGGGGAESAVAICEVFLVRA